MPTGSPLESFLGGGPLKGSPQLGLAVKLGDAQVQHSTFSDLYLDGCAIRALKLRRTSRCIRRANIDNLKVAESKTIACLPRTRWALASRDRRSSKTWCGIGDPLSKLEMDAKSSSDCVRTTPRRVSPSGRVSNFAASSLALKMGAVQSWGLKVKSSWFRGNRSPASSSVLRSRTRLGVRARLVAFALAFTFVLGADTFVISSGSRLRL